MTRATGSFCCRWIRAPLAAGFSAMLGCPTNAVQCQPGRPSDIRRQSSSRLDVGARPALKPSSASRAPVPRPSPRIKNFCGLPGDRHRQFGAEADVALDLVAGDLAGLEHDPGSFSFSRTAEPTATGIAPTPSGLRCVAENGRGRLVEPPTSGGQREVADSESYGRSR